MRPSVHRRRENSTSNVLPTTTQANVSNASNDRPAPLRTELEVIAHMTFYAECCPGVFDALEKRLVDKPKNWRRVLKALSTLSYLLHHGSMHVVTWSRQNIHIIKSLQEFQYLDEVGQDFGFHVRSSAKNLVDLIMDEKSLLVERRNRMVTRPANGNKHTDSRHSTGQRAVPQSGQKADLESGKVGAWPGMISPRAETALWKPISEFFGKADTSIVHSDAAEAWIQERPRPRIQHIFEQRPFTTAELKSYRETFSYYTQESQYGDGNYLEGNEAVSIFNKSGLPHEQLRQIWSLVDVELEGRLDFEGFCVAMRLICEIRSGVLPEIPTSVPIRPLVDYDNTLNATSNPLQQSTAESPPLDLSWAPNISWLSRPFSDSRFGSPAMSSSSASPNIPQLSNPFSDLHLGSLVMPSSNASLELSRSSPGTSSNDRNSTLGDFFNPGPSLYTDDDCSQLSRLLHDCGRQQWSTSPRIYIVLRKIGQLQLLDQFLDQGINDLWLPISKSQLPKALSISLQDQFLELQKLVLTKGLDLENPALARHAHFGKAEQFPFDEYERLGEGSFGIVDRVVSHLTGREYARKRFRRWRGSQHKEQMRDFKNELDNLKRIHHSHCVELVASYTDPKYFGILMSPVAHCNFVNYFAAGATDEAKRRDLMTFFGCLAHAVQYLHEVKIRHRDIKPENILVKGNKVYLTDFGVSLDWEKLDGSTTTKDTAKSLVYCSPEVARCDKRNSSADIWSLGCVFLEMWTVLNGYSVQNMRQFFKLKTESYRFYQNIPYFEEWESTLRGDSLLPTTPETWINGMLQEDPHKRGSAKALCMKISHVPTRGKNRPNPFCGECCIEEQEGPSSEDDSDSDPLATTAPV